MARRQGLMFQNVPDQLARVQNAQGNVLRAASLYQPKRGVSTKGGKQLNVSGLAAGLALGEMAYKGYDAMSPIKGTMTPEELSAAKEGATAASQALTPEELSVAQQGFAAEKGAESVAKEGVKEIAGNLATEAGGSTLSGDVMAAGSAAWEGMVAAGEAAVAGASTAANYLWTLLL